MARYYGRSESDASWYELSAANEGVARTEARAAHAKDGERTMLGYGDHETGVQTIAVLAHPRGKWATSGLTAGRPRKPNPQHVVLALRLDSPLVAALGRIAQRQASTRSALMRRAVEEYVERAQSAGKE